MPGKRPEPPFEFVQLLTSHQSRLYAYVLSLFGDRTQAEDVMQDTGSLDPSDHEINVPAAVCIRFLGR